MIPLALHVEPPVTLYHYPGRPCGATTGAEAGAVYDVMLIAFSERHEGSSARVCPTCVDTVRGNPRRKE